MAKLIKKTSALKCELLSLKRKMYKLIFTLIIFIAFAAVGNILMPIAALHIAGLVLFILSLLGFFVTLIFITSTQNEIVIKGQGVAGEDAAAQMLAESLDDSYTIVQNVVATLDGKQSEIDLVIIGLNGIFAIEVKNRNGRIEGNIVADRWLQHKIGRGGGDYTADFYSPVKQVSTHIFRLAGFLKQNGIRFYINGAVYFSNPEAVMRLEGEPDKIPVYFEMADLIRYIKLGNNPLSLETKEKIIDLLK